MTCTGIGRPDAFKDDFNAHYDSNGKLLDSVIGSADMLGELTAHKPEKIPIVVETFSNVLT